MDFDGWEAWLTRLFNSRWLIQNWLWVWTWLSWAWLGTCIDPGFGFYLASLVQEFCLAGLDSVVDRLALGSAEPGTGLAGLGTCLSQLAFSFDSGWHQLQLA